jgi:ABC-type nitrate/sulfonate/bicarbonate transport system substrate-binding protein
MSRLLSLYAVVLFTVGAIFTCEVDAADKPLRSVRIVGLKSYYNLPWLMAAEEGFFRDRGINVDYKLLATGSELILAISTNSADIGFTGAGPIGTTLAEKQVDAKIAAVVATGGVQLFATDPKITKLEDIAGKVFAISGTGASTDVMTRIAFSMQTGKDTHQATTLRPLNPPAQISAMALKQIDVGVAWDMYVAQAISKLGAHIVADTGEVWANHYKTKESTILSAMLVRNDLLDRDPQLVKDLIAAIVQATKVIRDNPEKVTALAQKAMGADAEMVQLIKNHKLVNWHASPTISRELAEQQMRFMGWQQKFGYIKGNLPAFADMWWLDVVEK